MRKLRDKMYKWKGMRERRREEREKDDDGNIHG